MKKRKFRSVVQKVTVYPLTIMVGIMLITIVTCFMSFFSMQKQMIDSNVNALKISLNQLENQLHQIDDAFIEYWNSDESYLYLRNVKADTPREEYLTYIADTTTWINKQYKTYSAVQGGFAYFKNLDTLIFRGNTNFAVNDYIKAQIQEKEAFNHWEIVMVEDAHYLINIKSYGNFYGGVWMPFQAILKQLGIDDENYLGTTYFMDYEGCNTLWDAELNKRLQESEYGVAKIKKGKTGYENYVVTTENLSMGILIPPSGVFSVIPMVNKIIFVIAFLALFLVPAIGIWLQRRIARPLRAMDEAMKMIGDGHMDYRIPLHDRKYYDEFDRLYVHFNKMVDELNELEFNLYKTKINEQRTELKYISQQIRPHFILNALNIIYTYQEEEFPLVKKMVLYLSEYFRYIINLRVDFVELEKEFRHVENYLKIQKERYYDRFDYFIEWEADIGECPVPPLIIQTFVENCIKYAMKDEETTFIYVLASIAEDKLKLVVADTGNGFAEETMEQIKAFIATREYQDRLGVGIQNAIERMDMLYEKQVELKVRNALSGGAVVEIYLPLATNIKRDTTGAGEKGEAYV